MKNWHRADACWEPYLSWPLLIRQEQAEQMNISAVTQAEQKEGGEKRKHFLNPQKCP